MPGAARSAARLRRDGECGGRFAPRERKGINAVGLSLTYIAIFQHILSTFPGLFSETAFDRALKVPTGDVLSERQRAMHTESRELFERHNDLSSPIAEADCAAVSAPTQWCQAYSVRRLAAQLL
jgi:hypothetical protein